MLAVHKPAGWTVYRESPSVPNALDVLHERFGRGVFPVHRLDRGTCGILLFASDPKIAERLQRAFGSRSVSKTYWAISSGELESPEGAVRVPLAGNKEKEPKPAVTLYRRLETRERALEGDEEPRRFHWIEAKPETGRYHQIRRHLKALGCPIVGDKEYGRSVLNERLSKTFRESRMLLSSVEVEFAHPVTGKTIRVRTKPDASFASIARRLGFRKF